MKKEFDPSNTHDQNVKVAIDRIIGQETTFRKVKKNQEDQKRILFCKIIDNIIIAEERSIMLDEGHNMDMNKYNQIFFDIITDFFSFNFSKKQINLINFYLYDRYSADGSVLDLVDDNNNIVPLETSADLWYLLQKNT
jgi:hypothetical protein